MASLQKIELIVPILKDWHSMVGKEEQFVGTACKGNTDAFKSHSPCNHRLLARRLPPQLVQYTEEEFFLLFFNSQPTKFNTATTRDTRHGKEGATSALGSTDPPNGSDPAAAAQALTKVLLHGLTAPSALGLPAAGAQALSGPAAQRAGAHRPCCASRHKSMPGVSGKLQASK